MKNLAYISIFLYFFLIDNLSAQISVLDLNNNWVFHQKGNTEWLPASVPGCVHTDLLLNKKIDDPFYRSNERDLQWIGEKDWEYKTDFDLGSEILIRDRIDLIFQGLDTYADVYLNDSLILKADNMHREWRMQCKRFVHPGKNSLRVYFHSVFKIDIPKYLAAPYKLNVWPNNDQGDMFLSVYARKAGFEYGWDWGPRLITSGIWRPVFIEAWNSVKINNVQVIQKNVTSKSANLTAVYAIESTSPGEAILSVNYKNKNLIKQKVHLVKGLNHIPVEFAIRNPKLWWTNGLGEPFMYHLQCLLINGNQIIEKPASIGIRTLEVVRENDKDGKSMYVKLNGVPVFMKGANYIPLDNFLNRVTTGKYEYIIKSAANSHMNMLRVWGGGTFENDIFYDLCDKLGILVFQDMLFACGMFPADTAFLNNVSTEVTENVIRLRNHPCIALWCGNNENQISYFGWGWKNKYAQDVRDIYEKDLNTLSETVSNAVKLADPSRYFHPTSPITGFNGVSANMGDVHYYGVWKGAPFDEYNKNIGRFMSEYGFQGFPEMKSLQTFANSSDLEPYSTVMLNHQRAKDDDTHAPDYGTRMIEKYMAMYYRKPKNFESFVYVSQVLQAKGIETAIEAHRRNMPFCMGSLYWQLNDCWPVISWSSIDYYGRWKALQYRAKEAYKSVLVSGIVENGKFKVYIISDSLKPIHSQLNLKLLDFKGTLLFNKQENQTIAANTSKAYFEIDTAQLLKGKDPRNLVFAIDVYDGEKVVASHNFFFLPEKDLNLPKTEVEKTIKLDGNKYRITLKTLTFAKSVYLSIPDAEGSFSDNYFDLLPGKSKTVEFTTNAQIDKIDDRTKVISLVDTY